MLLPIAYFAGPKPQRPHYSTEYTQITEDTTAGVKPGNHSIVITNDSVSAYCLLYLHGFSASPMEGTPVMQEISGEFGMNLFAPRLFAHGLRNSESLLDFNSEKYWQSAVNALIESQKYGDSVIIMATSTGATLALMLAAAFPEKVKGLILYSPNIDLKDPRSSLLTKPWGLQIARIVKGSRYHSFQANAEVEKYWNTRYRLEALVELKNMLQHSMIKSTFTKIHQPVLVVYYYKDEDHQDEVVSVDAIREMYGQLSTTTRLKHMESLSSAGVHALASGIQNSNIGDVVSLTELFMSEVMGIAKKAEM